MFDINICHKSQFDYFNSFPDVSNAMDSAIFVSLLTEVSCKSGIYSERGPKGPDF